MDVLILGAKSALAALLLVAGGAKLADLAGFAATVRLFLPTRLLAALASPGRVLSSRDRAARGIAAGIALGELGLGLASLCSPAVGWLNPVVFAVGGGFVVVTVIGFARYRGRSCRCFGALSQRRFDGYAIARAVAIAALAAVAMAPAGPSSVQLTPVTRVLLGVGGGVLCCAAYTAARALAAGRAIAPGWAE